MIPISVAPGTNCEFYAAFKLNPLVKPPAWLNWLAGGILYLNSCDLNV